MTKNRPSLEKLILLANDYINGEINTREDLLKHATAWYCFQFNCSFKDPVLQSHTFEELLLLYFMFQIKENPDKYRKYTHKDELDDYEAWLKEQMGDDYISEEEMISQIEEYNAKEKKLAETLPDLITTDFSALHEEN